MSRLDSDKMFSDAAGSGDGGDYDDNHYDNQEYDDTDMSGSGHMRKSLFNSVLNIYFDFFSLFV